MSDLLERLRAALADRYAIESEIGRGGMAVVFKAADLRHDRQVAVKVLQPEFAASIGAERFIREIEIVTRLVHPFILPIFDSGETDGFLYYVMPYLEGESLRDRLNREKQLPVGDSLRIAEQVADALQYAHRQGIVHRDIKPENILMEAGHAVVADFGIACVIASAGAEKLTQTGLAIGTPAYMSPEQAGGGPNIDGRSDVYALGCVLYEMLAGDPPYTGATAQVILARKSTESIPSLTTSRETVSGGLEAVIEKALAKAPADRFRTASEFSEALRSAESWSTFETESRTHTRSLWKGIVGIGLVAGVLLAIAAIGASSRDGPDDQPPRAASAAEIMQSRQMYLRAEAEWENAWGEGDIERFVAAVAMYDSAIALDSSNAKAWAALARSYAGLGVQAMLPSDSVFPLVMDPALRAIELDSTLAQAHVALALKYWVFDFEWIRAHDEYVRAAQLEPGTPGSYRSLAEASHILTDLGWSDSAVAIVRPVVEELPLAARNYAIALLHNGRLELALSEARRLDSVDVPAPWRWRLGEIRVKALLELGRFREAEEELPGMDSLLSANPNLPFEPRVLEAYLRARSGERAAAEAILDDLTGTPVGRASLAAIYAWLGDIDRALDLLEEEVEARGFVYWLPSRPDLAPLRTDPRFVKLLSQMGLSCQYSAEGHDCYQR